MLMFLFFGIVFILIILIIYLFNLIKKDDPITTKLKEDFSLRQAEFKTDISVLKEMVDYTQRNEFEKEMHDHIEIDRDVFLKSGISTVSHSNILEKGELYIKNFPSYILHEQSYNQKLEKLKIMEREDDWKNAKVVNEIKLDTAKYDQEIATLQPPKFEALPLQEKEVTPEELMEKLREINKTTKERYAEQRK